MKAQTVDVKESTGRILCCTIFRPGGKKLLAKGHVLSEEDVRLLETEGMGRVWVTELEEGEVGEDQAVMMVAQEMGCGSLEIRLAAGGRANLVATEDCCVLVDDELLKQINCTASVVIATLPNFGFARTGQRLATVKSAPFAVAQAQLEALLMILRERGPILQARPVRSPMVGVLYTDPLNGDRARQLFENIMRQRLERFGATANFVLSTIEEDGAVVRGLEHLLRAKPTTFWWPPLRRRPVRKMSSAGPSLTSARTWSAFSLRSSPATCFYWPIRTRCRSSRPRLLPFRQANVVDLILPPMLGSTGSRVGKWRAWVTEAYWLRSSSSTPPGRDLRVARG